MSPKRITLSVILVVILCFLTSTRSLAKDEWAENDACFTCHSDKDLKSASGKSLFVPAGFAKSVHGELSCIDCHKNGKFDDAPHWKTAVQVKCAECHEDVEKKYMAGFYDHLRERGFSTIPSCVQCHGNHEISHTANTRKVCGVCHNSELKRFDVSVHNRGSADSLVSCTSCHSAHEKSERGNFLPADWRTQIITRCLKCHKSETENYLASKHFAQVKAGNAKAPICTDCHGHHDIHAVKDSRSLVGIDKMEQTCSKCHTDHAGSIHRKNGADPKLMTCAACHTGHTTQMGQSPEGIVKSTIPGTCITCHGEMLHKQEELAHGKIMTVNPNGKDVNCTQCHYYHWKIPDEKHMAASKKKRECKNCHIEENKKYERSAHGIAFEKGHTEAPTCVTCHGDKKVERISSKFNGQSILSLCSSCHSNRNITMRFQLNPNVVSGYTSTYHGKMYMLGAQGEKFATCVSCHDNHLILASDDPQSSISKQNIVRTCAKCHKDANVNFVAQLQHYDPMAPASHPLLDFIHHAMVWLLRITLTIFGLHTIFWLLRSFIDRIRHGRQEKRKSEWRYTRFNRYDRITHAIMIISFLTLAFTGLPLKYSYTEAAHWIAGNVLNMHTMAMIHRAGAVLTFVYFGLHLGGLSYRIATKQLTLKKLLWGPDSLIPQPKDAKDFFQHVGYFLHISKRPDFDRFSYWEKFDYMAVFWGVAVIGASGLTLWFPTFFTKLLPGWAINAATIIHSEEALLATGFIFTIHFFNEHLRPENFPLDEVIFTGSMSEHYLFEERKLWLARLEAEGKLEQIRVKPMRFFPRALLYMFGFATAGIGLLLLGLIVIGTFTR